MKNSNDKGFQINIYENYPKILTPRFLTHISTQIIGIEEIYPHEKRPKFIKSNREPEVGLIGHIAAGIYISLVLLFIVGLILLILSVILGVSNSLWVNIILPIILIISTAGGLFTFFETIKNSKNERERNKKVHADNLEKYNYNLDKYNTLLLEISSDAFQQKERMKKLSSKLNIIMDKLFRNFEILDENAVKKGISEEYFYKFLKKYSDYNVYKSIKFSFYYPDLVLVKSNLIIILEIDEPYSMDNKEPIHYDSIDKSRDDYFLENDLVVIRFTEEQILEHSFICLEIINQVYISCMNLTTFNKTFSYNMIESPVLSYQEAFDLAYNRTRNSVPERVRKLELLHL
jgi:hypothetical protein